MKSWVQHYAIKVTFFVCSKMADFSQACFYVVNITLSLSTQQEKTTGKNVSVCGNAFMSYFEMIERDTPILSQACVF